jgi:GT2 family glycosyltransferase
MVGFSIIIITYNRPGDTLELLDSLLHLEQRADYLSDIVLVNNASTEDYGLVHRYLEQHPELPVQWIEAPGNLGVAGGRNYAVPHSKADWMLFLDDDVVIEDSGFLGKLWEAVNTPFSEERPLGAMGCKVRYYDNQEIQVTAFPHKNFEKYKDRDRFLTAYYVGCAHLIHRKAWQAAGEYPTDFFYGMEEYDLSYRILQAGYCIGYDGRPELFHKESPLGRKPRPVQLSMMWVNKSKVAWKYLPLVYFITTAFLWSGFYLRKTGFDFRFFFSSIAAILKIPFRIPKTPVGQSVRNYLKAVEARLWF